jgi:calcineurin-like phosphoesterase
MTGPFESVIGRRIDRVLETRLTANPTAFDVATEDVRLCGSIVDVDASTGKATSIERLCVRETELPGLRLVAEKASTEQSL